MLDCCHSGAATGTRDITSGGDSGAAAAGFLQRTRESFMSGNWERIVLAACPGDATARELPDLQHGAFTYYVLDHWQHSPDAVDVNTLFEAVSHELAGRHMPEPVMGGVQNGAFVLRPAQAPPAAAPPPAPAAAAPAPAAASVPISPEEAAQRARLYGTLTALDDANWTALLARLDVNPDNLPAGGRPARTRGLIADWAGQGLLSALESEAGLAAATQAAAAVRDAAALWPRQQAAIAGEDWDTAITLGRQILQEDPHQESARAATRDAYIARGDAHVEAGAAEAALADYGEALALDPSNALAYNQRGLALESFERYDDALADYTQAVALDPGNATTLANRANALLVLDRADEALSGFNAALEHAEDALIYNGRGLARQALGQYDEAVADYTQAITLDADFAEAYFNRGLLYHDQLGNRRGAMTDYNRAIRLDETMADAFIARGNLNLDLEHPDKALEDFDRALELDDQAVAAYLGRSDAYRALGQTRKANADLAHARALDPTIE